jgi:hypothetical protein
MSFLSPFIFVMLHALLQSGTDSSVYPQKYFNPPLDIPLLLAGNFGEPRAGHFHAGLDIQTKQVEGLPVYAAADGYVSRINVSSVGYGNALYVTHPNGYVTVYGHLKEFTPALMKRLRSGQYAKKSFAVDIELKPGEFQVKQGEQIAYSGSTGSSGGPHLHFEIRDAQENPINPLLFGFKIVDATRPLVSDVKFYPMDYLKYNCDGYRCKLSGKNGQFEVPGGTIKLNSTSVGVALNTYDLMDKSENRLGVYSLKMYKDGQLVYEYKMDKISFKDSRYVLSQIDYPVFINEDEQMFHRCYVEPGNKCPVYSNLVNRGIIDLSDGVVHDIKIEAGDFFGNISTVKFKVQYDSKSSLLKENKTSYVKRFDYNQPNEFWDRDIRLSLPADCLFDRLYFNYSGALSTNAEVYSKEHLLSDVNTCFFDWFGISIKADKLTERLKDKAVIVFKDARGNEFSRGGTFEDGFVKTKAREFGLCYIKVDTIPPVIAPVNIYAGKNMRKSKTILFKISDDLSGIRSFNTYLDGEWVVTDYDAKSSTLIYYLDNTMKPGEHRFKVVAEDERRNASEYVVKFMM